jgi:hypothetical protein
MLVGGDYVEMQWGSCIIKCGLLRFDFQMKTLSCWNSSVDVFFWLRVLCTLCGAIQLVAVTDSSEWSQQTYLNAYFGIYKRVTWIAWRVFLFQLRTSEFIPNENHAQQEVSEFWKYINPDWWKYVWSRVRGICLIQHGKLKKKLKVINFQYGIAFSFHCFEPCQRLLIRFSFFLRRLLKQLFTPGSLNTPPVQIDPVFLDFHHTVYFRLQYFRGDVRDRWSLSPQHRALSGSGCRNGLQKMKSCCEYIE